MKALEGKGEELAAILLEAAQLVSPARGCCIYLVSQDVHNASVVWVTEVWETQEDHDNSLKAPEVRALIGKAMPLLDGPPEKGTTLAVLGGKGLQ
ncbi:antibiotic biosynthesis monooxygenase [Hymenobacter sp. DG25B]|nr:antibiotic biosynthesis monooxygenase [Hymenobacter sp. DG25B]